MENARLQQLERQRAAELELANRDLEAFSLSVSHDLRAPLRAIIGFSDVFAEHYGPTLSDTARALLDRMVGRARLDRLIEDLLRFARSTRQALHKETVDCNELVTRVVADLRAALGDREVQVRIGALPNCQADPSLLAQVFVNLVSNSFKFTRDNSPSIVEIGSFERNGTTVLFVRDNSAGFDMRYADQLFGVFRRLHSEREFEGTGVGLSIVRRIIERHDGSIWAESAPGQGATFMFTLSDGVAGPRPSRTRAQCEA